MKKVLIMFFAVVGMMACNENTLESTSDVYSMQAIKNDPSATIVGNIVNDNILLTLTHSFLDSLTNLEAISNGYISGNFINQEINYDPLFGYSMKLLLKAYYQLDSFYSFTCVFPIKRIDDILYIAEDIPYRQMGGNFGVQCKSKNCTGCDVVENNCSPCTAYDPPLGDESCEKTVRSIIGNHS